MANGRVTSRRISTAAAAVLTASSFGLRAAQSVAAPKVRAAFPRALGPKWNLACRLDQPRLSPPVEVVEGAAVKRQAGPVKARTAPAVLQGFRKGAVGRVATHHYVATLIFLDKIPAARASFPDRGQERQCGGIFGRPRRRTRFVPFTVLFGALMIRRLAQLLADATHQVPTLAAPFNQVSMKRQSGRLERIRG